VKKQILWVAIGLVVVALAPAVAVAGDPGACLVVLAEAEPTAPEGGEVAYVCTDELDSIGCDFFCGDAASPEGGLGIIDCEWLEGDTCEDVADEIGMPWDGACELDDKIPGGELCALISEELPGWTSEEVCESGNGEWQGNGSTCGDPVPAMPRAGQAALIVVLMLGALVILNFSGIFRSA